MKWAQHTWSFDVFKSALMWAFTRINEWLPSFHFVEVNHRSRQWWAQQTFIILLNRHWTHRSRMFGCLHSWPSNRALRSLSPIAEFNQLSLINARARGSSPLISSHHIREVRSRCTDWVLMVDSVFISTFWLHFTNGSWDLTRRIATLFQSDYSSL